MTPDEAIEKARWYEREDIPTTLREEANVLADEVERLRERVALREAELDDASVRIAALLEDVANERLRYGQQRAANAVWMQHAAWLARHGHQEVALRVRAQADAAVSSVRAEDFVVAHVARAALKGSP